MSALGPQSTAFARGCALSIRVVPAPISFAERSSVLQVLEQHGRVEVFQTKASYNNTFLSVVKDPATAQRIIAISPLTYRISIPRTPVNPEYAGLGRPQAVTSDLPIEQVERNTEPDTELDTKPDTEPVVEPHTEPDTEAGGQHSAKPERPARVRSAQEARRFTLHIYPIEGGEYRDSIVRSQLRKQWPRKGAEQGSESYTRTLLKQSLPPALVARGLDRWLQDFGDEQIVTQQTDRLQSRRFAPSIIKGDKGDKADKADKDSVAP